MPITPNPQFLIGLNVLDEQHCGRNASKNTQTQSMRKLKFKIKIKSLRDETPQNFRDNLKEVFCNEIKTFQSKRECLVEYSRIRYDKQIEHLQVELKSKYQIINQLQTTLANLTNLELESNGSIIHRLMDT